MFFRTNDERLKSLEARLDDMEGRINKMAERVGESVDTITDVIKKMEKENSSLRKRREKLEEQKDRVTELSFPEKDPKLEAAPIKNAFSDVFRENVDFFGEVAREGLAGPGPNMYGLVRLLDDETDTKKAARDLGVHEVQVEDWAKKLEARGDIKTRRENGKMYMRRK